MYGSTFNLYGRGVVYGSTLNLYDGGVVCYDGPPVALLDGPDDPGRTPLLRLNLGTELGGLISEEVNIREVKILKNFYKSNFLFS